MIKFIYAGLAALFLLTAGYSYSQAAECGPLGTFEKLQEDVEAVKDTGISLVTVTPSQQANLVEAMGVPPNTDADQPFEMYLLTKGDLAKLFVIQDGCVTIAAGPGPLEGFLKRMGLVNAAS